MGIPSGTLYGGNLDTPGVIAQNHPANNIHSSVAMAAIAFGLALAIDGEGVSVLNSADDRFAGVAGCSYDASDFDNGAYAEKDPVAVIRGGVFTVRVGEAVSKGDALLVVHTKISDTADIGRFVKTATAGKTALVNGAEVIEGADAGGIAVVYIPEGAQLTATPAA